MESTPPTRSRRTAVILSCALLALVIAAVLLWPRSAPPAPALDTHASASPSSPARADAWPARVGQFESTGRAGAATTLALRRDAAAGDPVAMRELAEVILECGFGAWRGAAIGQAVDRVSAHVQPAHHPQLRAAAKRLQAKCDHLPGTRQQLAVQYRQLLQEAADKGDLIARLRQRSRAFGDEQQVLPDDAAELVEEALISEDPVALYELSNLYAKLPAEASLVGIGNSTLNNPALILLACERGLDCGLTSRHADQICLNSGECGQTLEGLLWRAADAEGETRALQARVDALRRILDEVDRAR